MQPSYDMLVKANLVESKPCPTPIVSSRLLVGDDGFEPLASPTMYRSLVDGSQYLTLTIHSFVVNKLSQYCRVKGTLHHGL